MTIIKHGRKIIDGIYSGTCNICGCEIECDKSEVPESILENIDLRFVKCPDCNEGYISVK